MQCGKYSIAFLTVMLIVCIWSNGSLAEESTFDIRTRKLISGEAKIENRNVEKKEKIASKNISISKNKGKSKKINKKQAAPFGQKNLKMQNGTAQVGNLGNSAIGEKQIQGVQRLLYVILHTDSDAFGNSNKKIDYLRCRTLTQTSINVAKLAKLRETISENVSKPAKVKETGSERVSYLLKYARL